MLDRTRQPAVGSGISRTRRERRYGVSVLLGERVGALLRYRADDDGRRLQLRFKRLVPGQVEGHLQGALDLREGCSERSTATGSAGE